MKYNIFDLLVMCKWCRCLFVSTTPPDGSGELCDDCCERPTREMPVFKSKKEVAA
jgi:hypothetical protein